MTGTIPTGVILHHLRTMVSAENGGGPTDRELLERFANRREETAFTTLVRRHGPLVLGVCRRILRHEQDAEDAFQATFLVLARKAREVGRDGSLAGWLHRVAYHAAVKARARTVTRSRHERQAPPRPSADPLEEVTGRELLGVIDAEVQQLSDACRAPLILCYLEGHTCEDAARQLGWSVRTLKRRLEQGRNCLRRRLARRGLALPVALLAVGLTQKGRACVPATLTAATIKGASTGAVGTTAGALADVMLRRMSLPWVKAAALVVVAALVVGMGALAHRAPAQAPDAVAEVEAPPAGARPAQSVAPVRDAQPKKAEITGRVVDADGKPVKDAVVAGYGVLDFGNLSAQHKTKGLGEVKTDGEGRFRIPLPDTAGERIGSVELLAGAKGYGPAWSRSTFGGKEVELRLPPEEAAVGTLIDLQGEPASKVTLRVVRILGELPKIERPIGVTDDQAKEIQRLFELGLRRQSGFEFRGDSRLKGVPFWPATVTTDADGRFRVSGFGKGQDIQLVIDDERFARQEITIKTGASEERLGLLPPFKVTGRVVTADTDKPVANAAVTIQTFRKFQSQNVQTKTDAEGRFSINAYPGDSYRVEVYPPVGDPYLASFRSDNWPKGAIKQQVDFKLPRGVSVRGKVIEATSSKAIVSASVALIPQGKGNSELPEGVLSGEFQRAWTGTDGAFEMVLPPGRGHLVVTGPREDYCFRTVTVDELQSGKPGGAARHFHAILPLELHTKDGDKEVKVELHRAITIKGKLVDTDGKPVKNAVVLLPEELLPVRQPNTFVLIVGLPIGTRVTAVRARDGMFELPNCDPERTYRVCVLSGSATGGIVMNVMGAGMAPVSDPNAVDATSVVNRFIGRKDILGAVADLSAKKAGGKPIELKLAKSESAEVRFVDAKGKAVAQKVWLELVVKPGEAALLATPYSLGGEKSPVTPDADGVITITGLIPGATYRLKVLTGEKGLESEPVFEKEFTVEAGKTAKLELKAPAEK